MKKLTFLILLLCSPALATTVQKPTHITIQGTLNPAAGWHKLPSTALCGGGSESNASYGDPNSFPANLGSYTAYGFPFADQCNELMEDSNSGAYDTKRDRLIIWGGGHSGYHGNDVFSLELSLVNPGPAMYHLDHPANPTTCPATGPASTIVTEADGSICQFESGGVIGAVLGQPGCIYANGCIPSPAGITTPGSVHTYNTLVYIPGYDEMTVFGGTTAPQGNGSANVWLLGMSSVLPSCAPVGTVQGCNPVWMATTNPAQNNAYANNGNVGSVAAYDPNTGGVWVQNENNLQWFNPATDAMTIEQTNGIGIHSTGVIDPIDKYFIYIGIQGDSTGPGGILYVNIACSGAPSTPSNCASTGTIHAPTTTGCTNLTGGTNASPQYMGAQWDPISKLVRIYPNGGNVMWLLNPLTWTCATETYGSTQGTDYPQNTLLPSGDAGTFGHFQYDPAFDVFVLCNDPHNDCWYLRPNR